MDRNAVAKETFFLVAVVIVALFGVAYVTSPAGRAFGSSGSSYDYTVSVSPTSGSAQQGNSVTATVTVNRVKGSAGVSLSTTYCPPNQPCTNTCPAGAACTFNPTSVTFSQSVPNPTSTMTITPATSTPAGSYAVSAVGTSGSKFKTAGYTLAVTAPPPQFGFSLSLFSSAQTITAGSSASVFASTTLTSGTTQPVTFTFSGCPPSATCSATPSSVNPSATATVYISTSAGTPGGVYPVTVTASGGGVSKSATYTVTVNAPTFDFSISGPTAYSIPVGGSTANSYIATLTAGTTQSVTWSQSGCPSGASCTFSPISGNPTFGTLFTIAGGSAAAGTYPLTLTATGGGKTKSMTFTLTITAPACVRNIPGLTISPTSQTGAPGTSKTYTVTVTNTDTSTCSNAGFNLWGLWPGASGWTATVSPSSLTLAPGTSGTSTLTVSAPATATAGTYYTGAGVTNTISYNSKNTSVTYVI